MKKYKPDSEGPSFGNCNIGKMFLALQKQEIHLAGERDKGDSNTARRLC